MNRVLGRIVSLDSFLKSIHWGHASDGVRRHSYNKILFLRGFSCGPNLCESRNLWEASDGTDVPPQNGIFTSDIPIVGMLVGLLFLLCSRKLATIKQLMWPQRPDWACFWLIANAGAPGNRSWSIRQCSTNSAVSWDSGSLRAISHRQWSACVDDSNLAFLVLGRLAHGRL